MSDDIIIGDAQGNHVLGIINNILFSDNLMMKLRAMDTVINSLPKEIAINVKAKEFQIYIHKFFDNPDFNRRLTYIGNLKSNIETALEYTGRDYPATDDYNYDTDIENVMNEIEKKLSVFIGKIIKQYNESSGIQMV